MTTFKILYINSEEQNNRLYNFPLGIIRISNFLNANKHLIPAKIEEEYLDLRFENLPKFIPNNLERYRIELIKLINKIYSKFAFNLVAVSCYSTFQYLNALELGFLIKETISNNCITIVGGHHPTSLPYDFHPEHLPGYFYDFYKPDIIPFNFVIQEEAEIGLLNLLKQLSHKELSKNKRIKDRFNIIRSSFISDLSEIPIIDYSLVKKYRDINIRRISVDFNRGCPFKCSFCSNSIKGIKCYHAVRMRPIELALKDLEAIKNTSWLNIDTILINDPIFYPKASYRRLFLERFKEFKKGNTDFQYQLAIEDRVDFCSKSNLQEYKELDIDCRLGLESISPNILKYMNKTDSANEKRITSYIRKARELIQISNEIGIKISFGFIFGFPGYSMKEFEDFDKFFFNNNGKRSLMECYNINLFLYWFKAQPGTEIFEICEEKFGSKIYFKNWWKNFKENFGTYAFVFRPSKSLPFNVYIEEQYKRIMRVIQAQRSRGNNHYGKLEESYYKSRTERFRQIIKDYNII